MINQNRVHAADCFSAPPSIRRAQAQRSLWKAFVGGILWILCVNTNSVAHARPPSPDYVLAGAPSYEEWKTMCIGLPSNRDLRGKIPPTASLPLKSFDAFIQPFAPFYSLCRTGTLSQLDLWLGAKPKTNEFFNIDRAYFARDSIPFQPFAQKLLVPPGSEVFFHGDFHGDIHSFNGCLAWLNEHNYLRGFTIARTNFHIVFLGDYTDRGSYGIEILYSLMRLRIANPDRVVMLRGNHEDVSLISRYGFLNEAEAKYGKSFDTKKVARAYDFFPAVLYLGSGSDFLQCNHGGMEPGYDPRPLLESSGTVQFQLLGELRQKAFLNANPGLFSSSLENFRKAASDQFVNFTPETPTTPTVLGFMWNDFAVNADEPEFAIDPGRAFVYGQGVTQYILNAYSGKSARLHAVFRAHQHAPTLNPMMRRLIASRGLYRHWQAMDSLAQANADIPTLEKSIDRTPERPVSDGSVWTFNVSPDSYYGTGCGYRFDTFGMLKTAEAFKDWKIQIVNVELPR